MEEYGFDAFGQAIFDTPTNQPFGFTGYQQDEVSGLNYAQARYYNQKLGRFMSEDNIKGVISKTITLNPYTYVWNNPLLLVDLDGNWPWDKDTSKTSNYEYDRDAALEYAEKWSGYSDSNGKKHPEYNKKDYYAEDSSDSTNFVSQVIEAGGIPQTNDWYYKKPVAILDFIPGIGGKRLVKPSRSWTLASGSYESISDPSNGLLNDDINISFNNHSQGQSYYDYLLNNVKNQGLQIGDLVYFDWGKGEGISHVMVITGFDKNGAPLFSGHTSPRDKASFDELGLTDQNQ